MDKLVLARNILDVKWTEAQMELLNETFTNLEALLKSSKAENDFKKIGVIQKAYDDIYVISLSIAINEMKMNDAKENTNTNSLK